MYYLKPVCADLLKGELYHISGGKRELIRKEFDFRHETDIIIKGSIICQWLTEGQTLSILDQSEELPSKYEFFLWMEEEKELAFMYEKAQFRRALTLTESLFGTLKENSDSLDDAKLQKTMTSVNELRKLVKNKDASIHTVINTRVLVPPIMEKWYDESYELVL